MSPLVTILIVLLIVSIITFFYVTTYNKLVLLRNKLIADWKQVILEINYRYELSIKYLELVGNNVNPNVVSRIRELDNHNKIIVDYEDVMNNYIDFEKTLFMLFVELEDKKISYDDWNNAYKMSKQRLDRARDIYNDDVLAINNKINLFPFSIVAFIGKFTKQVYFRNEN